MSHTAISEKELHQKAAVDLPLVSVLIPMLDEVDNIGRCIESLLAQTYPQDRIEIVVIDGISHDGSREVVEGLGERHPNIRLLDNPLKTTPRALNIGIKAACGDVVIILGAHTRVESDFIALNVHYMRDKNVECVGGTQLNIGDTYSQQAIGHAMSSPFGIPTAPYRYADSERFVDTVVYAAYSRALIEKVGYFDEDHIISEDAELNWRVRKAGYKIFFSPKIVSYYYPRTSLRAVFKQFFNYGMLRVNVIKKHRDAFKLLHLAPASFIAGLGFCALLGLEMPFFYRIGLSALALYLAFNLVGSLYTAVRAGWRYLPVLPLALGALHFGFGGGFLVGIFKTHKWGTIIPRPIEKAVLFLSDLLAVNLTFFIWAGLRHRFGFYAETDLAVAMRISLLLFGFWFLVFLFFGLYRTWQAHSRLDEAISVVKAVSVGALVIFLITVDLETDLESPLRLSRLLIVSYWLLIIATVGGGRLMLRTFQRRLLELGIGLRRALIVGWGKKARELFDRIAQYPALGYRVVGFVGAGEDPAEGSYRGASVLGSLREIHQIVHQEGVEELLIALDGSMRRKLLDVVSMTDGLAVQLKIVPGLQDMIIGHARTHQIYGLPLIEILPQYMAPWEMRVKRFFDILIPLVVFVFLPVWLLVAIAIKLDSPGPIFYRQKRVGKDGRVFTIYKFRSMIEDAEAQTGPKWADKDDPRITRAGRIIRRLRIDEVPQFFNVLKGDMSLVGPRPERPFFVERLRHEVPLYSRRLRVRPGITGWAQIKGSYDSSLEDVRRKLQYDLFYLENMSLRIDLKIILNTLYVMLSGRGQ